MMSRAAVSGEEPALTYRNMRAVIGYAALALPAAMVVTGLADGHLERSLSAYYYTRAGDVFTGALCVIGFFLVAYRIRAWAWDAVLTTLAGVAAFGVAFFHSPPSHPTAEQLLLGDVHLAFAAVLFIVLGAISLLIFPYADNPPDSRWRVNSYRALGALIWLSVILVPVLGTFAQPYYRDDYGFFILETICVMAFAVSFILKGLHPQPRAGR